jgi:two-component system, sensor histidine kinase
MGIRGKLVTIFLLIKVVPLILLGFMAWEAIGQFANTAIQQSTSITEQMRDTIVEAGDFAAASIVSALDDKAREAIEHQTTDLALNLARFLYDRDSEILLAADFKPSEEIYKHFLKKRQRSISEHGKWILNEEGNQWVPAEEEPHQNESKSARLKENQKQFHYREASFHDFTKVTPLYKEMTYISLNGQEIIKVTTDDKLDSALKDISKKENTYIKAETYFQELQKLKPGDIYVSNVIGAYVGSQVIGHYTKAVTEKKNIAFEPEKSAYAGKENPVGKRFEGIVRWATPVVRDGKKVGYVTLALDHRHIMEFSDHVVPTEERYSPISDASSGNYAFIWDNVGRNISHPRDYFIIGYDPKTGDPAVPWLSRKIYQNFIESGLSYKEFAKQTQSYRDQGKDAKPSMELVKQGNLGLDCRFLNFAPQCSGWRNLTENGGSGSFMIYWSGLWKLTTAATIPYYTGQYGHSKRGFGFVTIGANIDEFHRAGLETKESLENLIELQARKAQFQEQSFLANLESSIKNTARDLTLYTAIMIVIVILIAIWMARSLSARITNLIKSLHKIQEGNLDERVKVESKDEMGELATSLNNMTESLQNQIESKRQALEKAEASSRAKSDFLSNMSHELRTPLNAILGFSDLISREIAGPVGHTVYKDYARDIHNSGEHLLALINEILDISRVGSGQIDLEESLVEFIPCIEESMRMVNSFAMAKNVTINFTPSLTPIVKADARRLKQIILNLLSNAIKFSHENTSIEVRLDKAASGDIVFSVQDFGIGMDEKQIEIALTPFAQVQSSMSRQYEGTGLGLPLAKNLVEIHNGTLEVESVPDKGTTIRVTLPKERLIKHISGVAT